MLHFLKMKNNKIAEIEISYQSKIMSDIKIDSNQKAYEILKDNWNLNTIELFEEFKILLLNRASNILRIYNLSKGGTKSTVVDMKLLFSIALKSNASSIIVCHNHPSGNLKPSKNDIEITKTINKICNLFDIKLLDHLIITRNNYYSIKIENFIFT